MSQPFTHDDLYALLQLAGNDATAVQANGDQAVLDRMRQFMTAQLVEKLPQYDVFVDIATIPYSFDVGSWQNKVKADAAGQVVACTVTWASAPVCCPAPRRSSASVRWSTTSRKRRRSRNPRSRIPRRPAAAARRRLQPAAEHCVRRDRAGQFVGAADNRGLRRRQREAGRDVPGRRHAGREPEHADRELRQGKVRVVVTANGKPSKIGSRQVDIFKKTYFGLVGSEDGTDGDYNDGSRS